ncbi:MAG: transcription termination factor NusA [Flavobacteriales bacterium]|nr:transcription termination factor NusA [Flavobacteriales bacterium]
MKNLNLVESFQEFKEFKNIDRVTLMNIMEDVFKSVLEKQFGTQENIDVIVNVEKGDLEIYRTREIVENGEVEDPLTQIELSAALKIQDDFEVGEDCSEPVQLEHFGRRAVLAIRQNLVGRLMDLEKDNIFRKYKDREGELFTGEVYQIWKREALILDDEGNELVLPKGEQIPSDYFKKGETVKAVIKEVEMVNNNPRVVLSRTDPRFIERLFENEVPEVFDGLITIKKIVRVPGERAKVAVESYDDRVDPVGACVGMKGSRIHGIVRELKNENIDVINFTNNTPLFIQRALSPAKITRLEIKEETKRVDVFLKPDQVSLAIGKGGFNIRLAGQLTGYEIDVYRDSESDQEDVDLEEFADEIEGWVLDALKAVGFDTAKSVLQVTREDLVKRTDLEEETIDDILRVLRAEFED